MVAGSTSTAPASAPPGEPGDFPATTLSAGSLRLLVVEELPGLLELLASRAGPVRMAQAAGHALFRTLPCLRIEVRSRESGSGRSGTLISASRGEPPPESPAACAEEGPYAIEAVFPHETQARGFQPVVAALARIVAATDWSRRQAPPPEPVLSPPLPDPPSVSPEVRRIYEQAARLARGDVSVLIQGREIQQALAAAGADVGAAVELGIGRSTLYRRMIERVRGSQAAVAALSCDGAGFSDRAMIGIRSQPVRSRRQA